jgi:tetratricopeptide (TPR) repeat protein
MPEAMDEAIALGYEADELAVAANDPEFAIFSRSQLVSMCVMAGRLSEAREHVAHATAANAAAGGQMFNAVYVLANQVMLELLAGRFDRAEQLVDPMLAAGGGLANARTAQLYGIAISRVRGEQGRLAELEPLVRQLVETSGAPGWRARLGAMYVELGRLGDARVQLEELAGLDLEVEARSIGWLVTAAYLAEMARALAAGDFAARLFPLLAPRSGQAIVVLGVACNGSIDRHLGLLAATLGDWDAAATHFERALAMNRDLLESPPLVARTQVDYAGMLLDRDAPGDREYARALLDDAIAVTSSLGMLALGPRAVALREAVPA